MLPLGFAAFVLFGTVLVLPGASQDALARSLALDLERTGLLAAALSAGIGIGVAVAGPLVDRWPRRPLFVGAAALAGAALLGIDADAGFVRLAAHLGVAGVGAGAYETLLNAVAAERYGERAAQRIVALHAGAAVGAVAGPPLVGALEAWAGWPAAFRATGAGLVLLAAAGMAAALERPPRSPAPGEGPTPAGPGVASASLAALCVVGLAYVGVEAAVTVFAVPYAETGLGLDPGRGRAAISSFWLGLLGGRLWLASRRGRLDARVLAAAGAAGGVLLAVGVAAGFTGVELLLACVGIALGGVFPLMVALAADAAPHARGTATGLVAAAGAVGGFVVPWISGRVGDRDGVGAALATLALWCLVIAAAAGAVATLRRGPRAGGATR